MYLRQCQWLPFLLHNESKVLRNKGKLILELLNLIVNQNASIKKVTLRNALENIKLILPKIQNDIVSAAH